MRQKIYSTELSIEPEIYDISLKNSPWYFSLHEYLVFLLFGERIACSPYKKYGYIDPKGGILKNENTPVFNYKDGSLPSGTDTKPITLYVNPATFSIQVPVYWTFMGGTPTENVVNEFTIECVNGNSASEVVYYWINPKQ